MKKLLLILTLFLSLNFISQTISTSTVFWTTGWCNICGPTTGNYACASGSGSGNWNAGVRTFLDPVPSGHIVCAISVEVNKVDCGLTSMCVLLNGINVQCQNVGVGTNCNCGACWPQTYARNLCPFTSYVYGGINTLDLNPVGNLCVNNAVITIFSNPNCVGPCIIPLELLVEDPKPDVLNVKHKEFNPKIRNVTDMFGNDYGTEIPIEFKGVLIIKYEDNSYKKILK